MMMSTHRLELAFNYIDFSIMEKSDILSFRYLSTYFYVLIENGFKNRRN